MYAGADLSAGFDPLAGAVWVPDPPPQQLRQPQAQHRDAYYYDHDMYRQPQYAQMYPPSLPPTPAHSFQASQHQAHSHAKPLEYRPYEMLPLSQQHQQQQQYLPPTPALTTTRYPEGLNGSQSYGDPNKRRRVGEDDFATVATAAGAGMPGPSAGRGPLAQTLHPAEDYFRLPVASSPPRSHRAFQASETGHPIGASKVHAELAAQAQAITHRRSSGPVPADSWPTLDRQVAAQVATRRPSGARAVDGQSFAPSSAPGSTFVATSTPPHIPPSIATTAARPAQLFHPNTSAPAPAPFVVDAASVSGPGSAGPSHGAQRSRPPAERKTSSDGSQHRPAEPSPTLSTLATEGQTQISRSEKSCKACR